MGLELCWACESTHIILIKLILQIVWIISACFCWAPTLQPFLKAASFSWRNSLVTSTDLMPAPGRTPLDSSRTIYGGGRKLVSREAEPGTGLFQSGMFSQDWRKIQDGRAHRGSVVQAPSWLVPQGGWTRLLVASCSLKWVCAPWGRLCPA